MVKSNYFWDTGALILYFADHQKVKSLMIDIESEKTNGFITHLVLAEFYYKTQEAFGKKIADYRLLLLQDSKSKLVSIDFDDIAKIGRLKSKNRKLSMVDCVIGILAERLSATIITTDKEFANIKNIKSFKIEY